MTVDIFQFLVKSSDQMHANWSQSNLFKHKYIAQRIEKSFDTTQNVKTATNVKIYFFRSYYIFRRYCWRNMLKKF